MERDDEGSSRRPSHTWVRAVGGVISAVLCVGAVALLASGGRGGDEDSVVLVTNQVVGGGAEAELGGLQAQWHGLQRHQAALYHQPQVPTMGYQQLPVVQAMAVPPSQQQQRHEMTVVAVPEQVPIQTNAHQQQQQQQAYHQQQQKGVYQRQNALIATAVPEQMPLQRPVIESMAVTPQQYQPTSDPLRPNIIAEQMPLQPSRTMQQKEQATEGDQGIVERNVVGQPFPAEQGLQQQQPAVHLSQETMIGNQQLPPVAIAEAVHAAPQEQQPLQPVQAMAEAVRAAPQQPPPFEPFQQQAPLSPQQAQVLPLASPQQYFSAAPQQQEPLRPLQAMPETVRAAPQEQQPLQPVQAMAEAVRAAPQQPPPFEPVQQQAPLSPQQALALPAAPPQQSSAQSPAQVGVTAPPVQNQAGAVGAAGGAAQGGVQAGGLMPRAQVQNPVGATVPMRKAAIAGPPPLAYATSGFSPPLARGAPPPQTAIGSFPPPQGAAGQFGPPLNAVGGMFPPPQSAAGGGIAPQGTTGADEGDDLGHRDLASAFSKGEPISAKQVTEGYEGKVLPAPTGSSNAFAVTIYAPLPPNGRRSRGVATKWNAQEEAWTVNKALERKQTPFSWLDKPGEWQKVDAYAGHPKPPLSYFMPAAPGDAAT